MDPLKKQEQTAEVRKLRKILANLPLDQPPLLDWDSIESEVFSAIEKPLTKPTHTFDGVTTLVRGFVQRLRQAWVGPVPAVVFVTLFLLTGISVFLVPRMGSFMAQSPLGLKGEEVAKSNAGRASLPTVGRVFRTGMQEHLVMHTEVGTGFSLAPHSQLLVAQASTSLQRYILDTGAISLVVKKREKARYLEIVTSNAVCQVLGTVFRVEASNNIHGKRVTRLTVVRGAVRMSSRTNADQFAIARAGQQISMVEDSLGDVISVRVPQSPEEVADSVVEKFLAEAYRFEYSMTAAAIQPSSAFSSTSGIPGIPLVAIDAAITEQVPDRVISAVQLSPSMPVTPAFSMSKADVTEPPPSPKEAPTAIHTYTDTATVAGHLNGLSLFWEEQKIHFDTIGLAKACEGVILLPAAQWSFPIPAVSLALQSGKRFFQLSKPTALDVAVVRSAGIVVLVLSQWNGSIQTKDHVLSRLHQGYVTEHVVSNYLWERLDSVGVLAPKGTQRESRIRCFFATGGFSEFSSNDILPLNNSQILGVQGFVLHAKARGDIAGHEFNRLVQGVYCLVDTSMSAAALTDLLERTMNRMKIDISIKVPVMREITIVR